MDRARPVPAMQWVLCTHLILSDKFTVCQHICVSEQCSPEVHRVFQPHTFRIFWALCPWFQAFSRCFRARIRCFAKIEFSFGEICFLPDTSRKKRPAMPVSLFFAIRFRSSASRPRSCAAWRRSRPGTWHPDPRRYGCGRRRCPPQCRGLPPPAYRGSSPA